MNTYAVYKTALEDIRKMTIEEFNAVVPVAYIEGLENVWKFCGGRLKRERCGYAGIIGRYEYSALRVD